MAAIYDFAAQEKVVDLCAYRAVRTLIRAAGGEGMPLGQTCFVVPARARTSGEEEACAGLDLARLGHLCFRVAAVSVAAAGLALAQTPGAVALAFVFAAAAGAWECAGVQRTGQRRRSARKGASFTDSHSCEVVKKA